MILLQSHELKNFAKATISVKMKVHTDTSSFGLLLSDWPLSCVFFEQQKIEALFFPTPLSMFTVSRLIILKIKLSVTKGLSPAFFF